MADHSNDLHFPTAPVYPEYPTYPGDTPYPPVLAVPAIPDYPDVPDILYDGPRLPRSVRAMLPQNVDVREALTLSMDGDHYVSVEYYPIPFLLNRAFYEEDTDRLRRQPPGSLGFDEPVYLCQAPQREFPPGVHWDGDYVYVTKLKYYKDIRDGKTPIAYTYGVHAAALLPVEDC